MMLLTRRVAIRQSRCCGAGSQSFRVKMLLVLALAATTKIRSKMATPVALTLWAGVLLASRGIAFF